MEYTVCNFVVVISICLLKLKSQSEARAMDIVLLLVVAITLMLGVFGKATPESKHYRIVTADSTHFCQAYQAGSCLTLDQLSSQFNGTGDITLSFLPGDHLLTWDLMISGANEVTFNNEQLDNHLHSLPRITCLEGKNIIVKETKLFRMQGLVVHGCKGKYGIGGAIILDKTAAKIQNSFFKNNSIPDSGGALYILDSSYCVIESCVFQFNRVVAADGGGIGGGALGFYNGTITITNTSFEENSAVTSGGALAVGLAKVNISRCSFINNTAERGGAVYVAGYGSDAVLLSSGGNTYQHNRAVTEGGAVYLSGIAFFREDFFGNNQASKGSAVHLTWKNSTFDSCTLTSNMIGDSVIYILQATVSIIGSNSFQNNRGSLYAYYSKVSFVGNTLFSNNTGEKGGAITSIASTLTFGLKSQTNITKNSASLGGGCYLKQSIINILSNFYISENTAKQDGGGIYTFQSSIQSREIFQSVSFIIDFSDYEKEEMRVENNAAHRDGGGMYLSESSITIFSLRPLTITGNTAGHYGGGISTDSSSEITINNRTIYFFQSVINLNSYVLTIKSNSARKGGGVFIADIANKDVCSGELSCFLDTIMVYDVPSTGDNIFLLMFENNTAFETGDDIYGGLLDRCATGINFERWSFTGTMNGRDMLLNFARFNWDFDTIAYRNVSKSISSDPVKACICRDSGIDCDITSSTVFKKKGERFTLFLTAVDQMDNSANATLISSLKPNSGAVGRLKEGQRYRDISDQCTELDFNVYSNQESQVIQLYSVGPCESQGISKQEVNISFLPCTCPVGFGHIPSDIDCSCDCDRNLSQFISNCSSETETVIINSNVWIKYINSTNTTYYRYIVHNCPFNYCVEKPIITSLAKEDEQCAFNRTGTLCGECKQGLSLVFASSQCQQCSNYYLFLLLPFALAGIALVAFILMLNMTVAKGTIHGLIFYANMLAANRSIFLPFNTPNFLTVFISWLNLDLGIETCFYSGMDSYGKLLLQLVFPAYVLLLIAIIIILCNHSQRIAHLLGKRNPEATLYTLVLLSFSKLIRLIITALQFTTISYPDGTQERVWLYDANVLYSSTSHIPRFIAAIIITLLGTVYIALLLFGQLFNCCSGYRVMKWTTHKYYIHFLKAHHAPFSDKHRYWVGLLLLARLVHYLISAFVADSTTILSASSISISLILYKLLNETDLPHQVAGLTGVLVPSQPHHPRSGYIIH